MSFELPPALRTRIAGWLERNPKGALRGASTALSNAYARGRGSDVVDIAAYLTSRMPATFASISFVLREIEKTAVVYAPKSLLDAGAGPGTASLAALHIWPGLGTLELVEQDARFAAVARELLPEAMVTVGGLPRSGNSAELVIAAYVLAELTVEKAVLAAESLWEKCEGVLAVIEPGTREGFKRIKAVRDALLGKGAHILGPCTHAKACPIAGNDWCHFKVRLPRSRQHMHAKGAVVPFEDEAFSWIAFSRHRLGLPEARIVAPVQDGKAGLQMRLCDASGLHDEMIARRDKATYKRLRKLSWGQAVSHKAENKDADD